MNKILNKLTVRPVINGKQRHIRKEVLSVKSIAETTGRSIEFVLSMQS